MRGNASEARHPALPTQLCSSRNNVPPVPRPATGRPKETQRPRTEARPLSLLPSPLLTRRPGLAWPGLAPLRTGRSPRPLPAPFECTGPTGIGSREDLRQKRAAPSAGAPAVSRARLPGTARGPAGPRAAPTGGASFPPVQGGPAAAANLRPMTRKPGAARDLSNARHGPALPAGPFLEPSVRRGQRRAPAAITPQKKRD